MYATLEVSRSFRSLPVPTLQRAFGAARLHPLHTDVAEAPPRLRLELQDQAVRCVARCYLRYKSDPQKRAATKRKDAQVCTLAPFLFIAEDEL